jgi:hypothetical protein
MHNHDINNLEHAYDLLTDRCTPEDMEVFAKLKEWSAEPQVEAHLNDSGIMFCRVRRRIKDVLCFELELNPDCFTRISAQDIAEAWRQLDAGENWWEVRRRLCSWEDQYAFEQAAETAEAARGE